MNTQTNEQTISNKNNQENKKSTAAKVATGVAATAAAAGLGAVAASVINRDENPEAQTPTAETNDEQQATATEQVLNEMNDNLAANQQPQTPAAQAPAHQTPVATQPAHQTPVTSQTQTSVAQNAQEAQQTAHDDNYDIPVDDAWLNNGQGHTTQDDQVAQNTEITDNTNSETAEQQTIGIDYDVNDELINTVNVSPEVLMNMLNLTPSAMLETDGHTAALLTNEQGENFLLVDTDGDGILDKLTDMEGNHFASLDENTHFVVDATAMNNYIDLTNQQDDASGSFYADNTVEEAEIVNIEGEGEGEEIAYIDESELGDNNEDFIDDIDENLQDVHTDVYPADESIEDQPEEFLADETIEDHPEVYPADETIEDQPEEDLALNNDDTSIDDTDLMSFDDSLLA